MLACPIRSLLVYFPLPHPQVTNAELFRQVECQGDGEREVVEAFEHLQQKDRPKLPMDIVGLLKQPVWTTTRHNTAVSTEQRAWGSLSSSRTHL